MERRSGSIGGNEMLSEAGEKPTKKFKIETAPEELPLGMFEYDSKRWFRGYEVEKMGSDVLTSFSEETNPYKMFGRLVAKGLVKIFDTESGDEFQGWKQKTSKLFFQDVFFLMMEILIKTKGTSLVPTVYKCPQCKKFTKFENPIGEAGGMDGDKGFDLNASDEELSSLEMEDIRSIKFNPVRDLAFPELSFHFDDGVVIEGERFTEYSFRLPEIGDYILKAGASTDKGGEKRVLFHCLTSINGIKEHDLQVLKAKHGVGLLSLNFNDYMQILNKLNSIGYDFSKHETTCAHCGYDYKTVFDFSNFFGSLLGR